MLEDIKTRVGGKSRRNSVFEGYLENVAESRKLCNVNRLQHHQYKIEFGFLLSFVNKQNHIPRSQVLAWWCLGCVFFIESNVPPRRIL